MFFPQEHISFDASMLFVEFKFFMFQLREKNKNVNMSFKTIMITPGLFLLVPLTSSPRGSRSKPELAETDKYQDFNNFQNLLYRTEELMTMFRMF